MRTRHCVLGLALALAAMEVTAAPPPAARFQLQGQLQPAPTVSANSRFSLQGNLAPVAARPDAAARFTISARLDNGAKAACGGPDRIFGNGFESP